MQNQNQPQNPNLIKNPSAMQIPKTPDMNERDFLNDVLATEKYISDNFNIFAREASNNELHGQVVQILNETHEAARSVFNMMFQNGQYKLTAADPQQIQQAAQQFQNYQQQQAPYGQGQ